MTLFIASEITVRIIKTAKAGFERSRYGVACLPRRG